MLCARRFVCVQCPLSGCSLSNHPSTIKNEMMANIFAHVFLFFVFFMSIRNHSIFISLTRIHRNSPISDRSAVQQDYCNTRNCSSFCVWNECLFKLDHFSALVFSVDMPKIEFNAYEFCGGTTFDKWRHMNSDARYLFASL